MKIGALVVFLVLLLSDSIGISFSIVTGLSAKNVMLYILVIWITLDAIIDGSDGGFLGRRRDYLSLHAAFIAMILLAFFSMFASIYIVAHPGYDFRYGVIALKSYLVDHYLMLFVFLAATRNSRDALWMVKAMLIAMAFANTLSLVDMFEIVDLNIMRPRQDGRLQGPLGGSNEYGALMAFYIPLTLALSYLSRGAVRMAWFAAALTCVLVMIFTVSRGAIVGLVGAGIIGSVVLRQNISGRQIAKTILATVCIATIAVSILAVEYGDLLYGRFIEENISGSAFEKTSGRSEIWGDALALMVESPLTMVVGFGWKSFDKLNLYGSHSEYMEIFFNMGLVGLLLMIFIYFSVAAHIVTAAKSATGENRVILTAFLFGYLSVMISILFGNLHGPWLYIWSLTGAILRLAVDNAAVGTVRGSSALSTKRLASSPRYL